MGHVAALFVDGAERYTNEELALFNDVLVNLIDMVDIDGRESLSQQIGSIETTPRELVLKLANDTATVAAPVLQNSPVLTDDDLYTLAKTKGQDHLLAISKRDALQARVTDILLERGEQPVRRSVAANPGAELSDWGGRLLVKLAETDATLRESLTERHDLNRANFEKLLAMLPVDRQTKLRHIFENNERVARDLFREASLLVDDTKLERRKARLNTKATLKDIRDGQRPLDEVVIEYSLANDLYDLAFLLANITAMDEKFVRNVIVRQDIEAIAVLCRSLEIGEVAFSALCKARARQMKAAPTVVDTWIGEFRILSVAEAQRTMRFIKVRLSAMAAAA
ncbi:DUF2336 domain-containing protein [Microvirga tunisiensis]|uniref:DUF2336 domain-containing protein n=3 Tax=Pannonibacter tanglangensis TaxID=2750084 RepID=A0ABW9ZDF3_9HYPH|nr:DUF2336 domain-containing protein [Pannonibacter sp. XCT-34]NBN78444.1 DUF2336 domain-containing protein [Pannonibacter sp. XCT-53]